MSYFIGLLSGTSVDSIDAAIVQFKGDEINLIHTHQKPFSVDLKNKIQNLIKSQQTSLANYANIDHELAIEFSVSVNELIEKSNLKASDISAIGSHGQTIYHQPSSSIQDKPNTIQLGSPHIIAANTGIIVISNFRNMDMALNGQGAPLSPLLHKKLYPISNQNYAIVNLGGIANITFLGKDYSNTIGYDSGPANCLLDEWINIHQQKQYDENGNWARKGQLNEELLSLMLSDNYFLQQFPKSTGREYFNFQWYDNFTEQFKSTSAINIQTTLTHLTAKSISNEITKQKFNISKVILMGGGAFNAYLLELIRLYSGIEVSISEDSNWIESILFAYLAQQRLLESKPNLVSITNCHKNHLIGDIITN